MARLRRQVKLNRMDPTSSKTEISHLWPATALAFGCLLAMAACTRPNPASRAPQVGDTAVASVNGQTVWASDVRREAAAQGQIGQSDPLDTASALFHHDLDEVIDQKLLAAEATRRGLADDPQTKRQLAAARARILGDRLVQTMVEQTVSESSIRGLYNEEPKLSRKSDEFHARQIVTATQAEARAVRAQLAAGAAFDKLAMQNSKDAATRFNGGDLGYFTPDAMPPAYGLALKSAKAGDLVGPFQTNAGWVVMKVEDRRQRTAVSLEAARPQIVRFLTYNEVRDLLERLRRQSEVKLLIAPLPKTQAAAAAPPVQPQKKP
jgi:peptidyl-prolyl cis-trans isomerase C